MDKAHVAEVNVRNKELKPPNLLLLALEGRTPWEFGASLMTFPLLKNCPRGDGHSKANNVWRLYQAVTGKATVDGCADC